MHAHAVYVCMRAQASSVLTEWFEGEIGCVGVELRLLVQYITCEMPP